MSDDYAILVGISRYADQFFRTLQGPVRDVEIMTEWLTLPEGGNVPAQNVIPIVSDEGATVSAHGDMPPVLEDFMNAFMRVVRAPDRQYIYRPNGRLYLYFSGHGFSEKVVNTPQAALYTANADRDLAWNIFGTAFARWTKDQELFGEVVLIMDCCRDAELTVVPTPPPLRRSGRLGNNTRLFEVYAAPRGGKAVERPVPSRDDQVHGLLTHAFLYALDHAAPEEQDVSSAALKNFLEQQWTIICGDTPADPPDVVVPPNGELRFRRARALPIDQGFSLSSIAAGGTADIYGARFNRVARITVDPAGITIDREGVSTHVAPTNGRIVMALPAGFYGVNSSSNSELREFQAGGPDVVL